jgi:hypothetical protein
LSNVRPGGPRPGEAREHSCAPAQDGARAQKRR